MASATPQPIVGLTEAYVRAYFFSCSSAGFAHSFVYWSFATRRGDFVASYLLLEMPTRWVHGDYALSRGCDSAFGYIGGWGRDAGGCFRRHRHSSQNSARTEGGCPDGGLCRSSLGGDVLLSSGPYKSCWHYDTDQLLRQRWQQHFGGQASGFRSSGRCRRVDFREEELVPEVEAPEPATPVTAAAVDHSDVIRQLQERVLELEAKEAAAPSQHPYLGDRELFPRTTWGWSARSLGKAKIYGRASTCSSGSRRTSTDFNNRCSRFNTVSKGRSSCRGCARGRAGGFDQGHRGSDAEALSIAVEATAGFADKAGSEVQRKRQQHRKHSRLCSLRVVCEADGGSLPGGSTGHEKLKRTSLQPFARLVQPSRIAANVALVKGLDFLEGRLKNSPNKTVKEEDGDVDPAAKRKWNKKKGGKPDKASTTDAA